MIVTFNVFLKCGSSNLTSPPRILFFFTVTLFHSLANELHKLLILNQTLLDEAKSLCQSASLSFRMWYPYSYVHSLSSGHTISNFLEQTRAQQVESNNNRLTLQENNLSGLYNYKNHYSEPFGSLRVMIAWKNYYFKFIFLFKILNLMDI